MDVPLKEFTQPEKNFDILNAQVGGVTYNGFKKAVRFEDVPKPTELLPLQPIVTLSKKEQDAKKLAEQNAKFEADRVAAEKLRPKIVAPKELLAYIHRLIASGRKLRTLAFDIEFADSAEEIKNLIEAQTEKGFITPDEKTEILALLDGRQSEVAVGGISVAEEPMEVDVPELQTDSIPVRDGSVPMIEKKQEEVQQEKISELEKEIEEIPALGSSAGTVDLTKEERLEKLKRDHGIIVG